MPLTRSYILDEDDVEIIEQKSQQMGDASASAALRVIIREWNANQAVSQAAQQIQALSTRPSYAIER